MKTRLFRLSLLLSLCFAALCGCTKDDDPMSVTHGTTLTIHATADGFASADGVQTRASENGYTTAFTNGDAIGVFAVKDGQVIADCDNVPLTYDGTSWGGNTVYYYKDAKYFAYYPYTTDMTGKKSMDEIVGAFTPQSDQSSYENYTKSDLMTAEGTLANKDLSFSFVHKMSLIEITLPVQIYTTGGDSPYEYSSPVIGATFSVASGGNRQNVTPYPMGGGVYRYIVSAGGSHTVSGEFQTADGKTIEYSKVSLSLSVGFYKRLDVSYDGAPSENPQVRPLAVGDYYYSDGRICPGNVSNPPSEGCIGIIFSTEVSRIGEAAKEALLEKGVTTPHGLVMALTNASEGCRWGDYTKDENGNNEQGEEPFQKYTDKANKMYQNVDGYAETHWIIDTYGSNNNTLQNTYSAFYHASRYSTSDSSTERYAAPGNTTGWFIPGIGQWWDILRNLGEVSGLDNKKEDTSTTYVEIPSGVSTAVSKMNKYLEKITDATQFSQGSYFWSSSEYSSSRACYVNFYSDGTLYLSNGDKRNAYGRVRCVLAF
ncbi:fimbrillin family protein [Parabacteroides sp.]